MNKAFYVIAIPAFIVSFCWLYFGWGMKIAVVVIVIELLGAVSGIVYLRRKSRAQSRQSAGR